MEQHEMGVGPLLDEYGNIAEPGFAYSLVKQYDRKAIKASKLKIKEWDYYYIGNTDYGVALTIADNGYMSMASVSVLEFDKKSDITKSSIGWFPKGKLGLPSSSKEGDSRFKGKGFDFAFINEGKRRHLICVYENFGKNGEPFRCDIYLEETSDNSMVIATPFDKAAHFYYNQKINNLKASGYAKVGEHVYDFNKESYGVLDWGRGVWTYKNTWYWSSLNSELDGVPFGFNLGYGFGNTKAATENMLFVGENAYKLDDVKFDIPLNEKGQDDFMAPWKFRNAGGTIDLTFKPIYDRHADLNVGVIRSNQHQVFGTFSGKFLAGGKEFFFADLPGFAEKVFNKW